MELIGKQHYVLPEGKIYLNWAASCPALADTSAFFEYRKMKSLNREKNAYYDFLDDEVRSLVGRLFQCESSRVFIAANATSALLDVLDRWLLRHPNSTIIKTRQSYPSLVLAGQAVQTHWVHATDAGYLEAIAACSGTGIVLIEGCDYLSGRRYDINAIQAAAASKGLSVILDASQWPAPNLHLQENMAIIFAGHKWAGGPNGIAIGMIPESFPLDGRSGTESLNRGWRLPLDTFSFKPTAARLDAGGGGNPYLNLALLHQSLSLLASVGRAAVENHVVELATSLRSKLSHLNVQLLPANRASMVCFQMPFADFGSAAEDHGLILTSGLGRVRLSPAPFSSEKDVDDAVAIIERMIS
ncbi:MAG: aminotransferase class V-fold PLP-dependent enzyme [Burkholderiaceae bacterium]|nr:aminotransferase class V-fold PLP-dependent enzyme [Burkholderiaceae bacterium]